ncbi:MAG TPA: D-alanyl-D-alanine carboxypeptidase [Saprospiraceae bacterium]|nr:D-alanyl-D-alanine carboxypeptidase [Saprospiraceae bacterium]HMP23400.1 D-alanyl-D-alanine carboxypeptidase [Saprospiraceae bacterium]
MHLSNSKILKSVVIATLLLLYGQGAGAQLAANKQNTLANLVEKSEVFSKSFTGFVLFDPESRQFVYEKDADKYFTPASNTKIFTFYTALKVLGDSLPVLRYMVSGDTLVFWGTGNPLFLHPDFEPDNTVLNFLRSRPEKLFFSGHNFRDEAYGPGWSWDDYNSTYQPERSPFPMYGNMVRFERSSIRAGFVAQPAFFNQRIAFNAALEMEKPRIVRHIDDNVFEYNPRALTGLPFKQALFFRYEPKLIARLLSDTLGRQVEVIDIDDVRPGTAYTINTTMPNRLFEQLMQDSDNFIAEQLLLVCADKLFGTQKSKDVIEYASANIFRNAPAPLQWSDGSGLSRYNLFTPRTVVKVLERLQTEVPEERLLAIFPTGGQNGTIKGWYKGKTPYVHAKTGTLSNVHCLSGFVRTQKGKLLIFSFMHNNYTFSTNTLRQEMEKVLKWIAENY